MSDIASYLSGDESEPPVSIMIADPIEELRREIVQDVSPYNLVSVIVNLMFIVEERAGSLPRYQKVGVIVQVLSTFPELNDEKHLHHSLVEKLYRLADTNNLLWVRKDKPRRCLCCLLL